jgi:hypothetical protein
MSKTNPSTFGETGFYQNRIDSKKRILSQYEIAGIMMEQNKNDLPLGKGQADRR